MKKFGFGKKDDGDDSNRLALFGSKSKSKSPSTNNPYAQNPYTQPAGVPLDPYQQAKMNAYAPKQPASEKSGYGQTNGGDRYGADSKGSNTPYGDPSGRNNTQNAYGASSNGYGGGGYAPDRYGAQGGFGADKYGTSGTSSQPTTSRYGAGGYGGLGGSAYDDPDETRDALFGDAKDRLKDKPKPQPANTYGQPPPYEEGNSQSGTLSTMPEGSSSQGYGSNYRDRQLTAEEEEEEDIQSMKQQIRFTKQEDVASTRNALRIAQQAEETGRDTLARLGAQGEHLHNTEKNLDLAHNQNRVAEDKAKELKKLNRSMFAVHVANPFTAGARREARDADVINKHLDEREAREATRREAYLAEQRLKTHFKEIQPGQPGGPKAKNLAERAKYQFEADSEDEEMENEIDTNLDALGGAAGRLNALARATGAEVDAQNKLLDRIADKVSYLSFPLVFWDKFW
jgi:hypothetical protein